jgi:ABC-type oligopeptide transport system ATPase subunit
MTAAGLDLEATAAAAQITSLVRVEDLHVRFQRGGRTLHALRGVSLDIRPGEIVALVGESGSGKSVLGLTLLGLLPRRPAPEVSGQATVCGVEMVSATAEQRRAVRRDHLGAIFQDPTSTSPSRPRFSNCSRISVGISGPASCSSPMTWASPLRSRTESRCSMAAA